jgi:hypothetical protein
MGLDILITRFSSSRGEVGVGPTTWTWGGGLFFFGITSLDRDEKVLDLGASGAGTGCAGWKSGDSGAGEGLRLPTRELGRLLAAASATRLGSTLESSAALR